MRITVTAKPGKKKEYVKQITPGDYIVSVKEAPRQGRANLAIIRALAEYFQIKASEIAIVSGQTNKNKIFEVPDHLVDFMPPFTQRRLF